jgi:heme exporter protein D
MQFDSFSALMSMQGHGVFVWSVYGVAFVVLLLLAINPLLKKRRFFIEQSMQLRREQKAADNADQTTSHRN